MKKIYRINSFIDKIRLLRIAQDTDSLKSSITIMWILGIYDMFLLHRQDTTFPFYSSYYLIFYPVDIHLFKLFSKKSSIWDTALTLCIPKGYYDFEIDDNKIKIKVTSELARVLSKSILLYLLHNIPLIPGIRSKLSN